MRLPPISQQANSQCSDSSKDSPPTRPLELSVKDHLSGLNAGTESSVTSAKAWYLVHTKPHQEKLALSNLDHQDYECYLPQIRIERVRNRKVEVSTEPMFPRYLFIRLDSSVQGKSWSPIRSTLGVSRLVHFGTRVAKVEDSLVDLLRHQEHNQPTEVMFHRGESVVIADGPFSGIEAIYQTADAEHRALILLEILSKPVSMHIDAVRLRKTC